MEEYLLLDGCRQNLNAVAIECMDFENDWMSGIPDS